MRRGEHATFRSGKAAWGVVGGPRHSPNDNTLAVDGQKGPGRVKERSRLLGKRTDQRRGRWFPHVVVPVPTMLVASGKKGGCPLRLVLVARNTFVCFSLTAHILQNGDFLPSARRTAERIRPLTLPPR